MTRAIWKFDLSKLFDGGGIPLVTPSPWEPLKLAYQGPNLCLWAEVDPDAPKVARTIVIIGTGHPFRDAPRRYIGTIQTGGGTFIWHVYEFGEAEPVDDERTAE